MPRPRGGPPGLSTRLSSIAAVAAAAAPVHADWPISLNGTSFNGLTSNGLTLNVIEAHAALNGRVIGIELPPAAGEVY